MAEFRFYAELNDFLPRHRRGTTFARPINGRQSVKHVIEALGVPHTEIGVLLINGEPAGLDRLLAGDDCVAVLPPLRRLAPMYAATPPRFAADAHLGRLARYLRFSGFDTLWDNAWDDAELVALAVTEERVVLTRDRALLMHKALRLGCYLRDKDPLAQLADVARRFALDLEGGPLARCLECNEVLCPVEKPEVDAWLLPGTRAAFAEFWRCAACRRVFWRGSHWRRMRRAVESVMHTLRAADFSAVRS